MVKVKKAAPPEDSLDDLVQDVNKIFGAGAVMIMGHAANQHIVATPSGLLALDIALGIGGLAKGRVFELFGAEGGGKTTLALTMVATTQKAGGRCAYIDAEHGLDTLRAEQLGVDTAKMLISQPDNGEMGLDILVYLTKSGKFSLIVVDSVAGLVPKKELEGGVGDQHMALQARMMGAVLRKLNSVAAKSGTIVIFINQLRSTMKTGKYEKQNDTPGGRALKYFASIRLDVRKSTAIEDKDKVILGHEMVINIIKNRCAPPFRKANAILMFNQGFDRTFDTLESGVRSGVIEQNGSTYSFGETKLGVGKGNAMAALRKDPAMLSDLRVSIAETIKRREPHDNAAAAPEIDHETGEISDDS